MKNTILLTFLFVAVMPGASARQVSADAAALTELSQTSHLPPADLKTLLADCSANQQSMNFCAWFDLIKAKRKLRQVLAGKKHELPHCAKTFDDMVSSWERRRDASCEKSATEEWGEGSGRPAAQAICATEQTRKMTARIASAHVCPRT